MQRTNMIQREVVHLRPAKTHRVYRKQNDKLSVLCHLGRCFGLKFGLSTVRGATGHQELRALAIWIFSLWMNKVFECWCCHWNVGAPSLALLRRVESGILRTGSAFHSR